MAPLHSRRSARGADMRRSISRARSARRQAWTSFQSCITLEILHPRAQLDLPGPGAAMMAVNVEIGLRDRRRLEHHVGTARIATQPLDAAVDDEMGDMDVLRCKLARHALRQAAQ